MKRTLLLSLTALAALLASSCQKDDLGRVLTATIEQYEHNASSKAYINTENYACWENNDKVNINGLDYTISISGGNEHNYSASIPGTESLEGDLLAFYPASQVSSWNGDNVTISLPQVQTYEERNGHQIINNPMAAYCPAGSNELRFRNLAALLKVTLTAPSTHDLHINAILVKGDDGQMLWGTAPLTLNNQNQPILDKISGGSASVFLVFENPMTITTGNSKSFYIVVPARSNFLDFTIHIADVEQGIYRKVSKLGQSLQRNHIGALTYAPADNEKAPAILYTGSIEGKFDVGFESGNAQVISNADNVILFDNPISTIGGYAFDECTNLTRIYLPAGVTSIGGFAFTGCSSLSSISLPASLTEIGGFAFNGCSSLSSISLPASLTEIGGFAFNGCSGLTSITLPAALSSIGECAFGGCTSLSSISLPASLTEIGDDAFSGCNSLSSIDLSNTEVTSIEANTFSGCSGLASISLPASLTSIGEYAFYECTSLSSISLPASLTSIGVYAFNNCSYLSSIDLSNTSVTSIGNDAFEGCRSLKRISLPASLTSIGVYAFYDCVSLTTVDVNRWKENDNPQITPFSTDDMFSDCEELRTIYVPSAAVSTYKTAPGWSNYANIIQAFSAQ